MTEVSLAHVAQREADTQSLLLLIHPDHEVSEKLDVFQRISHLSIVSIRTVAIVILK